MEMFGYVGVYTLDLFPYLGQVSFSSGKNAKAVSLPTIGKSK